MATIKSGITGCGRESFASGAVAEHLPNTGRGKKKGAASQDPGEDTPKDENAGHVNGLDTPWITAHIVQVHDLVRQDPKTNANKEHMLDNSGNTKSIMAVATLLINASPCIILHPQGAAL